jgi:hypothetical protein
MLAHVGARFSSNDHGMLDYENKYATAESKPMAEAIDVASRARAVRARAVNQARGLADRQSGAYCV